MKPVVDKKDLYEPSYRMSTGVYIEFIEKNSDMDSNTAAAFIYEKGYLSYDDIQYLDGTQIEMHKEPNQKRIDDHGVDYEYEFYKTHPFLVKKGVCFYFDD